MLDSIKDAEVLAGVKKSTRLTLEVWLDGNARTSPVTTTSVTVGLAR